MAHANVVFLGAGPARPSREKQQGRKYLLLSRTCSGHIITPVSPSEPRPIADVGTFRYHTFPYYDAGSGLVRAAYSFLMIMKRALYLYYVKQERFDVVVSPNALFTGITALWIRALTRSRVIVEVNGNFSAAFDFGVTGSTGVMDRIKARVSRRMIPFVIERSDMVKLLYPEQLRPLNIDERNVRSMVFADYVPVDAFLKSPKWDGRYVLLLGYPWFLKGVDILIKAFNKISPDFPDMRLKIVGWCPEGIEYYERLAGGNPKIELLKPVYYEEVVKLMAGCTLYVLASRTEAMGRVLIEAMASSKPVIASHVDGVPQVVQDGRNGLLFPVGNVDELADKMRRLLSDPEEAGRLGRNGLESVRQRFAEEVYAERYRRMIEETTRRAPGTP